MSYTTWMSLNVWNVRRMKKNRTTAKTAASGSKNRPENALPAVISSCMRERRVQNDTGKPIPESGAVRLRTECNEENENLRQMRSDCQNRNLLLPQMRSLSSTGNPVRSLPTTARLLYRMRYSINKRREILSALRNENAA